MTQAYGKVMEMNTLEVEEIKSPKVKENEVDELLGDLNPRFFEEAMSLNEVQERIHSAKAYSDNIFNTYGF